MKLIIVPMLQQVAVCNRIAHAAVRGVSAAALAVLLGFAPVAWTQLPVGGYLGPDPFEEEIEEALESQIEANVALITEQNIQENIEENIEETLQQNLDETLEETIDENVTEAVEETVEATVVASVEENVQGTLEESFEVAVEESVEASVEESVADSVEDAVADDIEVAVESGVEEAIATNIEDAVEEEIALNVEDNVESSVDNAVEQGVEERVAAAVEERLETEIDEILEDLESNLEVDESRILKEQWLVMAEPAVFEELGEKGYLFDTVTELPGLGLRLAEVAAPSTFDITEVRRGVLDVVGKDRAEVDLNHIYTAGVPLLAEGSGVMPRAAMVLPADLDDMRLKIGMIDSGVDTTHPALARSSIEARSFARPGARVPDFHGTAIASIIVGNSDEYQGLAPRAEVYAASVFELDESRGEIASTVSLIRALDWLLSSGVEVVNISLAGPPNRLLQTALERAAGQNVVVMAAAGNGGPVARPMYPAAYPSVVAVTAVDAGQQVFRLANRGDYLALSAPGVDLRHAGPHGSYVASSGTSFAVPFAVTAAARLRQLTHSDNIVELLFASALDLGPPGRDDIYGYGLLTLAAAN